jgi:2Fe-2S ferredoxin
MPKITFETIQGDVTLEGRDGYSLMEIAVSSGVAGISGDCGGVLACATCHIHVPDDWRAKTGEPSEVELDMLDVAANVTPQSRLCCQIPWSDDLDGIAVSVPPED